MKFCILIIFKKSYLNFFVLWVITSLQDLSWDRPSDWKFHKQLVFHRYTGKCQIWCDRL